jgi:hypothetical protein
MIVAGLVLILFRKPAARFMVDAQNKTWGFHFGEKSVRWTERMAPVMGAIFVIASIAALVFGR